MNKRISKKNRLKFGNTPTKEKGSGKNEEQTILTYPQTREVVEYMSKNNIEPISGFLMVMPNDERYFIPKLEGFYPARIEKLRRVDGLGTI